jgi:hypothetical protein
VNDCRRAVGEARTVEHVQDDAPLVLGQGKRRTPWRRGGNRHRQWTNAAHGAVTVQCAARQAQGAARRRDADFVSEMVGGADHFGSSGVPLVVSRSCGDAESKKGLFTRVNIVRFTMSKVLGASALLRYFLAVKPRNATLRKLPRLRNLGSCGDCCAAVPHRLRIPTLLCEEVTVAFDRVRYCCDFILRLRNS